MKNRIWLTTDLHFSHAKMVEYCGRPKDFEIRVFKGLNAIPHHDTLICLGDVCIGNDGVNHERWIRPLACRKMLVRGNHDRKSDNWYRTHGWDFVCDSLKLTECGKSVLLTHHPTGVDDGGHFDLNVHGHCHTQGFRAAIIDKHHVLLSLEEMNYQPVLLQTMINRLDAK